MKIRKSHMSDLKNIMEIYIIAREFMRKSGNPTQWGPTNWPPENLIKNDIETGKSYVCVDDDENILGTFFFEAGYNIEPTYNEISDGSWKNDDSYGVVHRIAAKNPNMGVGKFCINWTYKECGHIRIDTHPDNKIMQRLLEHLEFEKRGIIYVKEDNYPRFAYEKI